MLKKLKAQAQAVLDGRAVVYEWLYRLLCGSFGKFPWRTHLPRTQHGRRNHPPREPRHPLGAEFDDGTDAGSTPHLAGRLDA